MGAIKGRGYEFQKYEQPICCNKLPFILQLTEKESYVHICIGGQMTSRQMNKMLLRAK